MKYTYTKVFTEDGGKIYARGPSLVAAQERDIAELFPDGLDVLEDPLARGLHRLFETVLVASRVVLLRQLKVVKI